MLVANASAEPPTLVSVGHDKRHPTATWSLVAGAEAWEIEVTTSPMTTSNGYFLAANVVDGAIISNAAKTSCRSPSELERGGTLYVHVLGHDPTCSACPALDRSNVLSFRAPPPRPLVIRSDRSIAGFVVKPNGRLSGAIRALGSPSSQTYVWGGSGCRVT